MTAIMGLSNSKNDSIYDPIRKKWIDKTPEELIRQHLIQHMLETLGYPAALIAIEKELSQLPHLKTKPLDQFPKRRADIIVFKKTKTNGVLVPLVMIECKSVPLLPKYAQQVIGYNSFVEAPFVSIANEKQILTGCYDQSAGMYCFHLGLPSFAELVNRTDL